jgi:hypothetical protein
MSAMARITPQSPDYAIYVDAMVHYLVAKKRVSVKGGAQEAAVLALARGEGVPRSYLDAARESMARRQEQVDRSPQTRRDRAAASSAPPALQGGRLHTPTDIAAALPAKANELRADVAGDPAFTDFLDACATAQAAHARGDAEAGGLFDVAYQKYSELNDSERWSLINEQGDYATALALVSRLFPANALDAVPGPRDAESHYFTLNEVGICLEALGKPAAAVGFFERARAWARDQQLGWAVINSYSNEAEANLYCGRLDAMAKNAVEARDAAVDYLAFAQGLTSAATTDDQRAKAAEESELAEKKQHDYLPYAGYAAYRLGDVAGAAQLFAKAGPQEDMWGTWAARVAFAAAGSDGERQAALELAQKNLAACKANDAKPGMALSDSTLGRLEAALGERAEGRSARPYLRRATLHHDAAVDMARGLTAPYILVEVLAARGRFLVHHGSAEAAEADLTEARRLADEGGYRLFGVEASLGLAELRRAQGNERMAMREAERALEDSRACGFSEGQQQAQMLLVRGTR